ncbi:MAG: hypothetical protein WEC12_07510 [Balneolaceae bacterium]
MNFNDILDSLGFIWVLVALLISVLWIIMPFYLISARNEIRRTNRLLTKISKEIKK